VSVSDLALSARTVEDLVRACQAGSQPKFLHFWGHTARGPEVGSHVLSQWFPATFEDADRRIFRSAEHYMMWRKATLFGDNVIAEKTLAAASPGEAKELGRTVNGFSEQTWLEHRWAIVVEGSTLKFSSDQSLRDYLIGTRDRVLVEASPRDRIWGIGMTADSEFTTTPGEWRGLNLLGFALMEARSRMQE
jgi:ribA/ribD-fused uncharacterized protein